MIISELIYDFTGTIIIQTNLFNLSNLAKQNWWFHINVYISISCLEFFFANANEGSTESDVFIFHCFVNIFYINFSSLSLRLEFVTWCGRRVRSVMLDPCFYLFANIFTTIAKSCFFELLFRNRLLFFCLLSYKYEYLCRKILYYETMCL